jgi:threonine/homoserine/homoserine lactone efflux protein
MTLAALLAFNAVLLAALASPGPAMLLAVRASIANGRGAGIATGAGLATMASLWTLSALLGLDAVFSVVPWAFAGLKICGALYLLYLAWTTWRGAAKPPAAGAEPRRRAFRQGVLVNLGNPKSMLFAAAVIVVVFPQHLGGVEIALVVANHLLLEIAFYTLMAVALSTPAARLAFLHAKPLLDRIAATILAALGLRLLTER